MLKNYLKIACRNLLKHKGYSFINISGLAVGLTCCLLIGLYVFDELSFDRYHENADRMFRVTLEKFEADGKTSRGWAPISPGYGPKLQEQLPAIEETVRFWLWGSPVISHGDKKYVEQNFAFTESSVFSIFTLPFVQGNPQGALDEPNSVVLTESTAQKYFGDADVVGKIITYKDYGTTKSFKITGVIRDIPKNSHLRFDFLASFSTFADIYGREHLDFMAGSFNFPTYALLKEGTSAEQLIQQFPEFIDRNLAPNNGRTPSDVFKIHLQPVTDIYLHSDLNIEYGASGDINNVYIFSVIAFLVLLVACINFINLATARASRRAKEIGLRKVLGAHKKRLVGQFLCEAFLHAFIALSLALLLFEAVLPIFNSFAGKELVLNFSPMMIFILLSLTTCVGLVAGVYPALVLSQFQPARVLHGSQTSMTGRSRLRAGLVIFQFAVSIGLIISVGMVRQQIDYLNSKELGFEKEQLLVLPGSSKIQKDLATLKHQLQQNAAILNVTASSRYPSGFLNDALNATVYRNGEPQSIDFRLPFVGVDHGFFETYGIETAAGRTFSAEFATDLTEAFVLNETAVSMLGWSSPQEAIGSEFGYGNQTGRIIGVVNDFHFESLHQKIKPMVFDLSERFTSVTIRVAPGKISDALAFLKPIWTKYRPDYPFSYRFVDEQFEKRYAADEKLGQIFGVFSGLAVFIACLGLLGLTAFMAERRFKEIGIRKVLGATISDILTMISADFMKLVLLANIVAWPVAWIAINRWLDNFAYRMTIDPLVFIAAGGVTLAIALITISFQTIKAASANPVEALRNNDQ